MCELRAYENANVCAVMYALLSLARTFAFISAQREFLYKHMDIKYSLFNGIWAFHYFPKIRPDKNTNNNLNDLLIFTTLDSFYFSFVILTKEDALLSQQ